MLRKIGLLIFMVILTNVFSTKLMAQVNDKIEGNWLNEEQTAKVHIYMGTDKKFYGKIVWLKVPLLDGKPKVDSHNPVDARKNDPLLGLLLLKGFKVAQYDTYEGGTIYDPKNGKTYSCKITRKNNTLDVRGFVGFSMFGRTTVWTKAD